MLYQCRTTVYDAGPTLKQQWVNFSPLLSIQKVVYSDSALYVLKISQQNMSLLRTT